MSDAVKAAHDLSALVATPPAGGGGRISTLVARMQGSEILRIAADVRAMLAQGAEVCNLTVGDFAPNEFPAPQALVDAIVDALRAGETNYPPSDGVLELRKAVSAFYREWLGLEYGVESILITGGSRPGLYATYAALVAGATAERAPSNRCSAAAISSRETAPTERRNQPVSAARPKAWKGTTATPAASSR
jgi:hypothetical protein